MTDSGKMINKLRMLLFLGLLTIALVSGCIQEKIPEAEVIPTLSPTAIPAAQPSAKAPAGAATQVSSISTSMLTVDKNGSASYTRIQDAINNASNGDTILIYSGTYYETVDINKQLILRGVDTGGGKPVVNANRSGNPTGVITLSAGNSVLEGFTAIGSAYKELYYSAGIWVNSHNNQIRNNTVSNNPYGITLYHYSSNNTLSGNNISNNDYGIALYNSHKNILSSNNASNNKKLGIYLYYSNNNTLTGNNIIYNNYGIDLPGSSNNTIYDNLFNNGNNIIPDMLPHNTWNTTKQSGINIIGEPYLGGNYWANPGGIDFSVICSDSDHDGMCDSPYTLDDNNSDYLPLAYKPGITNTILIEDTDLKFSNKCEIKKIPRATNGSLLACLKAEGEKINVTFTGTAASIIFIGNESGGIMNVQIDGKYYPEINTASLEDPVPLPLESGLRVIQRIASNLQNTSHILTFEIANRSTTQLRKQNEAGDIYIDAIEISTAN